MSVYVILANEENKQGENNKKEENNKVENEKKYYKVGYSKIVDNRIYSMQTNNHFKLTLVKSFECIDYNKLERLLHIFFKQYRVRGEWFLFSDEDLAECLKKAEELTNILNSGKNIYGDQCTDSNDEKALKATFKKSEITKNASLLIESMKNNDILHNDQIVDKKIIYIKNILNKLGYNNVDDFVKKEIFEGNIEEMIKIMDNDFRVLFKTKNDKIDEIKQKYDSNRKLLGFLNGLIHDYNISIKVIMKSKRDKKHITKYVAGYKLVSMNNYVDT